jgi:hypothetical protein
MERKMMLGLKQRAELAANPPIPVGGSKTAKALRG